jgi:hypothetical protein
LICGSDFILVDYANQESVEIDAGIASPRSLNTLRPFLFFSLLVERREKKGVEVKVKKLMLGVVDDFRTFLIQNPQLNGINVPFM